MEPLLHMKDILIHVLAPSLEKITLTTKQLWERICGWAIDDAPRPVPVPTLVDQLHQAWQEFLIAQNFYNSVSDCNLLNYAMYQMLAAQNKYTYFLRKIRAEGSSKN